MHRVDRLLSHLTCTASSSSSSSSSSLFQHVTSSSSSATASAEPVFKNIKVETKGRIGIITLDRPAALNAINDALISEVGLAIERFEANHHIGCLILTGSGDKAFAAGADIKEMKDKSYFQMSTFDKIAPWEKISKCKLPIIAAVNGVALGGGCEIAMMCDIIIASEKAKFGQPEIKIGTIPGAGGTQRLTKAIGKSKAMEMVLTGNMMTAAELEKAGLVSRVVPQDKLMETTLKLAEQISSLSLPIVKLAKESVLSSFETSLNEGMHIERRLFHSTFALKDQKEGMSAFATKRTPHWRHE